MFHSPRDTIVAIATPPGESAIGMLRLSGERSHPILGACFHPSPPRPINSLQSGYQYRGWIIDRGKRIDDVLVVLRRGPRSYTGEDMAEICAHGSRHLLARILRIIEKRGARMADPGEFTRRAFLKGKISLSEAEAVAWLIQSRSDEESALALRQLSGEMEKRLSSIKADIIHILSTLEHSLDFDDREGDETRKLGMMDRVNSCIAKIRRLISESKKGMTIRSGPKVVIAGKPNVGKSSLFNRLAGRERAIVSPYPGTTRDTLEETVSLGGIAVSIIDTAGVRETKEGVEAEGVRRAREKIRDADLVLAVLDRGTDLDSDDRGLLKEIEGKKAIVVINKMDLVGKRSGKGWAGMKKSWKKIFVSARDNLGISELEKEVTKSIRSDLSCGDGSAFAISSRRASRLEEAAVLMETARGSYRRRYPPEFIAGDIRKALDLVLEVRGERYSDEILDDIFSRFCVGK